jgi:hypothetical protein
MNENAPICAGNQIKRCHRSGARNGPSLRRRRKGRLNSLGARTVCGKGRWDRKAECACCPSRGAYKCGRNRYEHPWHYTGSSCHWRLHTESANKQADAPSFGGGVERVSRPNEKRQPVMFMRRPTEKGGDRGPENFAGPGYLVILNAL